MGKFQILLLSVALLTGAARASPISDSTPRDLITIDGHDTTIAQATAEQIDGTDVAFAFADLIYSIIMAFNEPEFDYWGNVKEEVEALVGAYINEHNMHQVAAFEADLQTLLERYLNAPDQSDDYPDKNQQASALSMAIMSHRYLVMSGDLRHSLLLHFEDIASMHIVVLKDAAETYSTEASASQWWVDLDDQLEDYIAYTATVTEELQEWRLAMVSCSEEINSCRAVGGDARGTCYDTFTATDGVTGEQSVCRQLHDATDCTNHCQVFQQYRQQDVDRFVGAKVSTVLDVWQKLKELSAEMAAGASPFYNPIERQ